MEQYKTLLKSIIEKGTIKSAAREGMPHTTSLFGYQFRHDLSEGFPALTTKKLYWKGVVVELLWFLKGDTNIKYLDENGVRKMWHEDAYNYYLKTANANLGTQANQIYYHNEDGSMRMFLFEEFCDIIKNNSLDQLKKQFRYHNYVIGDCGSQYGELWRNWDGIEATVFTISPFLDRSHIVQFAKEWREKSDKVAMFITDNDQDVMIKNKVSRVDQIKELIDGLKNNPMSRRHIITAWNPATLKNMALNACHAFVQFNCRPLTREQRQEHFGEVVEYMTEEKLNQVNAPKYFLDCQMYQRSADAFLGVPLNIASYALLTQILCKICNMIPGDMIYTYGDVHIYENHQDQVAEQLDREERSLPTLQIKESFADQKYIWDQDIDKIVNDLIVGGWENVFRLENYDPHPAIAAKLSTGLK